ncbi:MAG: chromosome segregation protein SMC, partial [Pirellulales bacterium]
SRFKAKKIEAIRRLDRVEQNLLRLSDIVDEVDNRLRTIRSQAAKAQRYKEYTDRLQGLRTQVGLADWRHLTEQLTHYGEQLERCREKASSHNDEAEQLDAQLIELEQQISRQEEEIRRCDSAKSENRERIVACESTIEHQRGRCEDHQQEVGRYHAQLAGLSTRTRDLGSQLETTSQDVTDAENRHAQVREQVSQIESSLSVLRREHEQRYQQEQERRGSHVQMVRQSSERSNEITSLETKIHSAGGLLQRCADQLAKLVEMWDDTSVKLDQLRLSERAVSDELKRCETKWQTAKKELENVQNQLVLAQAELGRHREAFSAANERAMVLQELQRQLEGISTGVKEVLVEMRQSPDGPFRDVRGVVADILEVRVDMALLIETALGERAGFLVVEPSRALRQLLVDDQHKFSGRVAFVPTKVPGSSQSRLPRVDLADRPAVVGRADEFVQADPRYQDLTERLLGNTWIVDTLAHALELAQTVSGQNFVTQRGQLLAADGTICVGPKNSSTGLISRRSELRALEGQLAELVERIDAQSGRVETLNESVADIHAQVETLAEQRDDLHKRASEIHRQMSTAEERQAQLDAKKLALDNELSVARGDRDAATTDLALVRDRRREIDQQLAGIDEQLKADQQRLNEIDSERQRWAAELTTSKVELAKSEQMLDALAARMRQVQQDRRERQRAIDESRALKVEAKNRVDEAERSILRQQSELAEHYLRKEQLAGESAELVAAGDQRRERRSTIVIETQKVRSAVRKLEQEIHEQELKVGKFQHDRDTLATRMLDDYQIDLAQLQHHPTEEEQHERDVVEEEIADLRRKINNIGNVNLEALEELEELDTRFTDLSTQFNDLTQAKETLEQIIDRINDDSRRLFQETLETVRGHFQTLFRKLFGGGQADIVIDEDQDILESGLEIVARPPGKEPRSISLLSGGEKTMTCVALLLAIFRSRPSPFCILDEVDAALDEANIDRFIGVLNEFLQWTQFIVVTHSKKTMTCAGTLYGVTMQESGISKRVSVRFDDVSETGEILRTIDDDEQDANNAGQDTEDDTQAA